MYGGFCYRTWRELRVSHQPFPDPIPMCPRRTLILQRPSLSPGWPAPLSVRPDCVGAGRLLAGAGRPHKSGPCHMTWIDRVGWILRIRQHPAMPRGDVQTLRVEIVGTGMTRLWTSCKSGSQLAYAGFYSCGQKIALGSRAVAKLLNASQPKAGCHILTHYVDTGFVRTLPQTKRSVHPKLCARSFLSTVLWGWLLQPLHAKPRAQYLLCWIQLLVAFARRPEKGLPASAIH